MPKKTNLNLGTKKSIFCLLFFAACLNAAEPPITGRGGKGDDKIDPLIVSYMEKYGAKAAVLAISYRGRIIYSKGYGWSDEECKEPVKPNAAMRIASVSKPITAAMVRKLVRETKISLKTRVFPFLGKDVARLIKDDRLNEITIGDLLEHKGGWDRDKSFDPVFGLPEPDTRLPSYEKMEPKHLIAYMASRPLQFDPGTKSVYSNFGYVVLGQVIEKATGLSYKEYLHNRFLPLIHTFGIDVAGEDPNESLREVSYPPSARSFNIKVMDGAGGLIASAPALCAFMKYYWISGEKRRGGTYTYTFFGSMPGTCSVVRQRPDEINYAAIFNNRLDGPAGDLKFLASEMDKLLDELYKKK
jgi:CubicO group peptidase (beta-lactamase class C family)